ncbi:hypothetical protein GCM10008959_12130 [Deinococcus seoulensis]|uniref:Uncharacterized protein n=1 Tax=Deinococcus seoulensis TaxID=1837379 RepID=A0ABQ2RSK2_9DEIO|nr:hypothetical protein GCM10008959_12130 [Deinococcus seoulensis]
MDRPASQPPSTGAVAAPTLIAQYSRLYARVRCAPCVSSATAVLAAGLYSADSSEKPSTPAAVHQKPCATDSARIMTAPPLRARIMVKAGPRRSVSGPLRPSETKRPRPSMARITLTCVTLRCACAVR